MCMDVYEEKVEFSSWPEVRSRKFSGNWASRMVAMESKWVRNWSFQRGRNQFKSFDKSNLVGF